MQVDLLIKLSLLDEIKQKEKDRKQAGFAVPHSSLTIGLVGVGLKLGPGWGWGWVGVGVRMGLGLGWGWG